MAKRPNHPQSPTNPPSKVASKEVIEEERGILSKQYEMMQHIDDRALRITRTSTVLLGITFTGLSILLQPQENSARLMIPNISKHATWFGTTGIFLLTLSIIIGIVTTQYSRPIYGIGERLRHGISARWSGRKALAELSDAYDDEISVMQSRLERNRRLLWSVQIVFILGLICLVVGSSLVLRDAIILGSS